MSWEPGRPLLRKENGRWKQVSHVEMAEASTVFMTLRDDRKLDAWMYKKKIAVPKKQWNRQKEQSKKKGGDTNA